MEHFVDAYIKKEMLMYVNRVLPWVGEAEEQPVKTSVLTNAHVAELAYRNSLRTRRLGVGIPPWVLINKQFQFNTIK